MATPPQDRTFTDLLRRHLTLLRAPIPDGLPKALAAIHILNRCTTLQDDLLLRRGDQNFPQQLYNELHEISIHPIAAPVMLQLQLALAVQRAIRTQTSLP